MSKINFEGDYFDVEADPHLSFIMENYQQREPLGDSLFPQLFPVEFKNQLQVASSESVKIQKKQSTVQAKSVKKQVRKRQTVKLVGSGKQRGHWCVSQNKRYHWFLEMHFNHFLNKHLRRMDRIFKSMEIFIDSREAQQCRSHHQKMQKKHGNFINILKELRTQHYNSFEIEPIIQDMKSNGVQCKKKLLSSSVLQYGGLVKNQELTSQSYTLNECQVQEQAFIDPLLQIQQGQCSLGALLLL